MRGLVFTEFLEMVENEFGIEVVDQILANPELSSQGSYTSVGNYPHEDILLMVADLSEAVGIAPSDLIVASGKYLFHQFARKFPFIFENQEDPLRFLEGIETVIHTEVRKLYADEILPRFVCHYQTPDELHIHYKSDHPMADLIEGLILGCIEYFNNSATLERSTQETDPQEARFIIRRL